MLPIHMSSSPMDSAWHHLNNQMRKPLLNWLHGSTLRQKAPLVAWGAENICRYSSQHLPVSNKIHPFSHIYSSKITLHRTAMNTTVSTTRPLAQTTFYQLLSRSDHFLLSKDHMCDPLGQSHMPLSFGINRTLATSAATLHPDNVAATVTHFGRNKS